MILACPSDQSLRSYAIGDVDDELSEEIEQHLGGCPSCEETVARFDGADDTLIRHLPLAAGAAARQSVAAPGWLARLRNGPPADGLDEPILGPTGPQSPSVLDAVGPEELAAYELLGVLGRGGMGVVYRARHRQLQRHVALKVLNPRLMATPEGIRRFEREIRILGGLRHSGIVMATDAGRVRGSAYLVMELVEGVDLSRLVKLGGPFSIAEACEAARQMAEALAAAHEAGAVHRDVKPSNAMIDRHGRVKLLDFGLARVAALSTQSLETSVGCLLGTLDYMAPEQADSDQPIDPRADFFGLGATLFFLLTGRPPRGGVQRSSLLQQLSSLTADAPRISSIRGDIPPELDDFLARLLSRNPQDRPDSARSIAAELSQWAGADLATRVQEFSKLAEVCPADDEAAAQRSLSELLCTNSVVIGEDAAVARPVSEQGGATEAGSRRGRKWLWMTLIAATVAASAIYFGFTMILHTPQGTLRIESEVDNVRVEIVDEAGQTKDLTIDRSGKETRLQAGKYRLRLAGQHDGMVLDHDTVTLTRSTRVIAKITSIPAPPPSATGRAADQLLPNGANGGLDPEEVQNRIAARLSYALYFTLSDNEDCKKTTPAIRELQRVGYPIFELDVPTYRKLAKEHHIRVVPYFIIVAGRGKVETGGSAMSESKLRQHLQQYFDLADLRPNPIARILSSVTLESEKSKAGGQQPVPAILPIDSGSQTSVTQLPLQTRSAGPTIERLYQGKTEAEWHRLFQAETAPKPKLEAGRALLSLAAELPAPQQIESILSLQAEIARTAYGQPSLEYAFAFGHEFYRRAQKWRAGPAEVKFAEEQFHVALVEKFTVLSPEQLATGLTRAFRDGSDFQAAVAHSLLAKNCLTRIQADPAAAKIVLKDLKRDYSDRQRAELALLVRAHYVRHASPDERRGIFESLDRLGLQLKEVPAGGFRSEMKSNLLTILQYRGYPEGQKLGAATSARIVLEWIVQNPGHGKAWIYFIEPLGHIYQNSTLRKWLPPYFHLPHHGEDLRRSLDYLAPKWVEVANGYLKDQVRPPYSPAVREVLESLNLILGLRADGDDWPVDKTAAILTEQLRNYYTNDPAATVDQPVDDLVPISPAMLLTQIVHLTGEIPDFVRTGHPRPKLVAFRLKRWEHTLAGHEDKRLSTANLLNEAPYETIKRCVEENQKFDPAPKVGGSPLGAKTITPPYDLLVSVQDDGVGSAPLGYIERDEPLLFLAVLADQTGKNDAQDDRIASLFAEDWMRENCWKQLEVLLASKYKARESARRILQKMAAKAKSKKLKDALNEFDFKK